MVSRTAVLRMLKKSSAYSKKTSVSSRSRSPLRKRSKSRGHSRLCPPGHILRKGYTRRTYVNKRGRRVKAGRVSSKCIKGRGAHPGRKGPKIIPPLRRNELKSLGYSTMEPANIRHNALSIASKRYGGLSVFRKLNAVEILTRNTSPRASAVFAMDKAWVKKMFLKR